MHDLNEVLADLARTPGKSGDLTSLLRHIAQTAQESFATDACAILAFNWITGGYIGSRTVVRNSKVEDETLYDQPEPNEVAQQILSDGVVIVEDLDRTPEYHTRFTRTEGILAFVGLALRTRHRSRPLGVLYLEFRQAKAFSSTDHERFRIFAAEASLLLQETELLHNYEEVQLLGQKINHNLSTVVELFQQIQTFADAVLDESHTMMLAIYQPQTNTLDIHIRGQGNPFSANVPLQAACEYVVRTQKPQFIQHLSMEAEELPFHIINLTGTKQQESYIFVPLMLRGVSLGVLSIQHPLPNAYGQDDLLILQLLANYISLALHNMLLFSDLSQLNETGQLLTQQLDSELTLQATVDKIYEATRADVVILYPYEATRQRFMLPPRIAGTLYSSPQSMFPKRSNDIAEVALHHEEPIFAKQSGSIYSMLGGNVRIKQESFQQREKITSTAVVPLQVGDESVGVLFVNFREAQRFGATQKVLIKGLANYAAIAIKNAQQYGTLSQRRIQELEILQNIERELNRTLNLESLLNTLLTLASEQVNAEEAAILLYNSRKQALEVPAAIGANAESMRKDIISLQNTKYITRWVLEHKKPVRVYNVHNDPQWQDIYIQGNANINSELAVPLLDGDEAIGVLNFESKREGAFQQEDEDFLLALAGQAVLAIKNAKAFEREKRLAEEAQVLNEISKEIISQLDLSLVFDLILEKALELTHSTLGSLHLYDRVLSDLHMVAERGTAEDKKGKHQSLDEGIVGYTARNERSLNVGDVSQPPWDEIYTEFIPGTRSELAVPMFAGNELRGVLNVESPHLNNFSESDERLLQGLADLAVIALQNAKAYEREKRLAEEAQVLNEISKEITSQLDPVHVFDLILEKALELTRSNLCSLMLYDPDQNDLSMVAERGVAEDKKGKRQSLDEGIVGYTARNWRSFKVADVSQPPWDEIYTEFIPGTRSELAVPMFAGSELRGVLNVESPHLNNFSESDERLLQGLADLAVIALQNAKAYEREKRLAEEGRLLNEISKEIIGQLDPVHVFDLILEKALELTHSTEGSLLLYDRDQNDLGPFAARGVTEDKKGFHFTLQQGIVGNVARNKKLINADLSQPVWKEIHVEFTPGMNSELAVPMLAGSELRGVLYVESPHLNNFSESDERLLQGLADLAVIALQNAQAYEREKRLAEEARVLNVISKEITSQLDPVHVFDLILEKALELTHSTIGALMLYDSDQNDLWMAAERGLTEDFKHRRIGLYQGIVGYVATQRQLLNVDPLQLPWKEMYLGFATGTRSELAVPMLAGSELRGVLNVESPQLNNFTESDERLLQGLADLAVVALQNAERYEQARREAQRFELLYKAGQELGKITELSQLEQAYTAVLKIAMEYSQSLVVIRRYDEDTLELVMVGASRAEYSSLFPRQNLDEGVNGQVSKERRTIVIDDTNNPPSGVVTPQLSDPTIRSLLITPIMFKERYYGNLGLSNEDIGSFRSADRRFLEGLAQQLASTIYRLETVEARQEFEQRARAAEVMSSIGQVAFELTHHWDNDLGLFVSYVNDIQSELEKLGVMSQFIAKKLDNIIRYTRKVLNLSKDVKQALASRSGEGIIGEPAVLEPLAITGEPVIINPRSLFEEIQNIILLPPTIQITWAIDEDVAAVRVFQRSVIDILRNLVTNAVEAMPEGGSIKLGARNVGRYVILEVTDTGVGISQQNLAKIFDFSYTTKGSSGFGLWSARLNALRNLGDLTVKSEEGQGTTFTLRLLRVEGGLV